MNESSSFTAVQPNYSLGTRELIEGVNCALRPSPDNSIRIGAIGYGYWGPNVVRNLYALDNCRVVAICDKNQAALRRANRAFSDIELTTDVTKLLTSPQIDAVAVVTPVWTHFELAKCALENGKHVFVEKPFTSTTQQAEELIELAERKRLKIMVDHTFLFTGSVRKIRQLVDDGTLGPLYYFDSIRVNLGLFQHDVNVMWDLAPHDLSIMNYVIREKAEAVVATGGRHLNGLADVAFITVYFPSSVVAHINVNWLSPVKIRTTLIGGEKKMLVWDDLEPDEKIKVYDKGVQIKSGQGLYDLLVSYRSGDVWAPKVEQTEALKVELEYFLDCIANDRTPLNDGVAGLGVVKLLEAADRSLEKRGQIIRL
ncbi:MAG: oxidoreductase [Acidobacteria bacterium]|nr:MAG: oxidoreductase [Acidobacteriota bacterium]